MDDNKKDTIGEEVSAFGQRAKGDIKEATGTVTGNDSMHAEGMAESTMGAARQKSNRMVTGLFKDRDSAERAYGSVSTRGYDKDDVNLLMSDETRKTHFGDHTPDTELGSKALEGAGVGSAIGGTTGAVLGAIAAIGTSVVLPGLGLIVAGPLLAALAGAGAGGATGGLIGALIGSGIPEDRAVVYDEGVRNGGIVMASTRVRTKMRPTSRTSFARIAARTSTGKSSSTAND